MRACSRQREVEVESEGAEPACLVLALLAGPLAGSRQRDGLALGGGQHQVMLSARLETCPRATFSGAVSVRLSLNASLSPCLRCGARRKLIDKFGDDSDDRLIRRLLACCPSGVPLDKQTPND